MPAWSYIKAIPSCKALRLSIILILLPLLFQAQSLTGLWSGALHNDSSTVRRDQSFEIALTEYNGKVYGYSRSEFIVDDTLYYILKRVKGTINGDVCEVKDDEIVSYNFRGKLDKGIKVTSTFRRNQSDSSWYLDGTWKTNATKKYFSVSGKVNLSNEKDLSVSKIFPHLEELKLAGDVAFYADRVEAAPVVKVARPEKLQPSYSVNKEVLTISSKPVAVSAQPADPVISESVVENISGVKKPGYVPDRTAAKEIEIGSTMVTPSGAAPEFNQPAAEAISAVKKAGTEPLKTMVKEIEAGSTKVTPPVNASAGIQAPVTKAPASNDLPSSVSERTTIPASPVNAAVANSFPANQQKALTNNTTATTPVNKTNVRAAEPKQLVPNQNNSQPVATAAASATKPVQAPISPENNTAPAVSKPVATNTPVIEKKMATGEPAPFVKTSIADITEKAAVIAGRKSEFSQIVNFKSDSVIISLYDNGEIDGDTVSVFLNGEVLLSKQGLKSSAVKKTIYINRGGDEDFTLVMFAESLGKYPPNTGLLVIRDGDDVYNLRFSSDFQKNAGIVFRKKK